MDAATTTEGEPFGRYRLLEKLGQGGMAETHRATLVDGGFEKRVCLKRVLPEHRGDRGFLEMFHDEARIAAQLQHSNIVQVFELGDVDGTAFMAMELVDGCSLATVLKRGVRATVAQALAIGTALTRGLDYAHRATVDGKPGGALLDLIHRDVTPDNILLSRDGEVKLADFGIARARDRLTRTKTGIIKGKLPYMAPEQARAEHLDQRVDQWAAGVVVWELLTGRPLFRRKGEFQTLKAVAGDPVPPPSSLNPDVPGDVDAVVLRALRRPREQRFSTTAAFHDALAACLVRCQRQAADVDLRPLVAAALAARAKHEAERAGDVAQVDVAGVDREAIADLDATVSEGAAQAFESTGQHRADRTEPSLPPLMGDVTVASSSSSSLSSSPAPASSRPASVSRAPVPSRSSSISSSPSSPGLPGPSTKTIWAWVVFGVVAGVIVVAVIAALGGGS